MNVLIFWFDLLYLRTVFVIDLYLPLRVKNTKYSGFWFEPSCVLHIYLYPWLLPRIRAKLK
jgi:hypothetical protein